MSKEKRQIRRERLARRMFEQWQEKNQKRKIKRGEWDICRDIINNILSGLACLDADRLNEGWEIPFPVVTYTEHDQKFTIEWEHYGLYIHLPWSPPEEVQHILDTMNARYNMGKNSLQQAYILSMQTGERHIQIPQTRHIPDRRTQQDGISQYPQQGTY